MKYVKINLSFGDKIKLLLFNLVPENKLPTKEVVKEVFVGNTDKNTEVESINKSEEDFSMPFFDTNDDKVESNF